MKTYSVLINKCYGGYGFSKEFEEKLTELTGTEFPQHYVNRHDEKLIALYNAFIQFNTNPNGHSSNLQIVNVPVGLNYEINEHAGSESLNIFLYVTVDELAKGLSKEKLQLLSHTKNIKLLE